MPFMCVCNPVDVWDYEAFFATSPTAGYWVFPQSCYSKVKAGDSLVLRLTSKAKNPGVCATFTVLKKRTGECPNEHWRIGRHPKGLQYIVDLRVEAFFPQSAIGKAEMLAHGISETSRLIKVPQVMASEISGTEMDILQSIVAQRISR